MHYILNKCITGYSVDPECFYVLRQKEKIQFIFNCSQKSQILNIILSLNKSWRASSPSRLSSTVVAERKRFGLNVHTFTPLQAAHRLSLFASITHSLWALTWPLPRAWFSLFTHPKKGFFVCWFVHFVFVTLYIYIFECCCFFCLVFVWLYIVIL